MSRVPRVVGFPERKSFVIEVPARSDADEAGRIDRIITANRERTLMIDSARGPKHLRERL
jgi:hypothetical protein